MILLIFVFKKSHLDESSLVLLVGPDGHERLADADAGNGSLGLAEGSSHSSLEPGQNSCYKEIKNT